MKAFVTIILMIGISSCNKKKRFDGPDSYTDGFETYSKLEDLLPEGHDDLWSFTQQTRENNTITVDTTRFHSGNKALKFSALTSEANTLSKCSISKQNMAFWEGETLRASAWYYIEGENSHEWLFLMDLEEQAAIGAGPGMRLVLVDNKIRVEHKFFQKDIIQEAGKEINFPRNQWVELVWEIKLSRKKKGSVKVWQNGELIIQSSNRKTQPKDFLYSQQGTMGRYSSIEIGITANSYDGDLTLWVDDFNIQKR